MTDQKYKIYLQGEDGKSYLSPKGYYEALSNAAAKGIVTKEDLRRLEASFKNAFEKVEKYIKPFILEKATQEIILMLSGKSMRRYDVYTELDLVSWDETNSLLESLIQEGILTKTSNGWYRLK